jgi:hypothetical protein
VTLTLSIEGGGGLVEEEDLRVFGDQVFVGGGGVGMCLRAALRGCTEGVRWVLGGCKEGGGSYTTHTTHTHTHTLNTFNIKTYYL